MNQTSIGQWKQVSPHVFVTACEPHGVNVGLVVGEERALLVDTGNTAEQGAALVEQATRHAGVPVTHAVVTHAHHDHWFGLAGMTDVVGIAHENLVLGPVSEATTQAAADLGLDGLPQPTETFSMAKAVDLGGGIRVELLHFGAAHTTSDVLVYVPGDNLVFAGDMLESAGDPQFDETSNPQNWPTALDGVLGVANEKTVFVPGHGEPMDQMSTFVQRAEIAMLHGTTEMLIEQGTKLEDAYGATEWPFTRETLETALPLVYAALDAKGVKPRTQLPISSL